MDMYFTMNDRHSLAAMNSMTFEAEKMENRKQDSQTPITDKHLLNLRLCRCL
jgi:hypothetical protein